MEKNEVATRESLRARALVKKHLEKPRLTNVYVVDNISVMLEVSIALYDAAKIKKTFQRFSPHRK